MSPSIRFVLIRVRLVLSALPVPTVTFPLIVLSLVKITPSVSAVVVAERVRSSSIVPPLLTLRALPSSVVSLTSRSPVIVPSNVPSPVRVIDAPDRLVWLPAFSVPRVTSPSLANSDMSLKLRLPRDAPVVAVITPEPL